MERFLALSLWSKDIPIPTYKQGALCETVKWVCGGGVVAIMSWTVQKKRAASTLGSRPSQIHNHIKKNTSLNPTPLVPEQQG